MNKLVCLLALCLISPLSFAVDDDKPIELLLKVKYVEVEHEFYGFEALDGQKYLPINMPESFQQDGLPVRVTAVYQPNMVGIHLWGQYIRIISIQAIDCENETEDDEVAYTLLCESVEQ